MINFIKKINNEFYLLKKNFLNLNLQLMKKKKKFFLKKNCIFRLNLFYF
jgi:hypothetical protein